MTEYKVKWIQCPTNYNDPHILFIEANSQEDAEKIARDHVERRYGIEWFQVKCMGPADPVPEGKVRE